MAAPCVFALCLLGLNVYIAQTDPEGPWARGALRSTARGTYSGSWNPMGLGTYTYDPGTKPKARQKFGDGELPNQMTRSCLDYTSETCGYSNLFTSGCVSPATCNQLSGRCRCPSSMCASSSTGQCTPWTPPDSKQTRPDHPKILCPVLAALYNAGDLRPDEYGRVTEDHLFQVMTESVGAQTAAFQGLGVSQFKEDDHFGEHSSRCAGLCFFRSAILAHMGRSRLPEDVRYLNIFTMGDSGSTGYVKHGVSTGVREVASSNSDPDDRECGGIYPCAARFDRLVRPFFDEHSRLYKEGLVRMMVNAREHGDHGNLLWGSSRFAVLQNWQQEAALGGWLNGFGRDDGDGRGQYMMLADTEAMFLEGRFFDGWVRARFGVADSHHESALAIPWVVCQIRKPVLVPRLRLHCPPSA